MRTLVVVWAAVAVLVVSASAQTPELEAGFARMLSGAVLEGHFTDDAAPDSAPTKERYEIAKVTKLQDKYWRFEAKIEYGTRSVSLPLDLEVEWAGDTPVVTLTDLSIPGMGKFTARVLFYRDQYAGTWQGDTHGGHLYGNIVRPTREPASVIERVDADDEGDDERMDGDDGVEHPDGERGGPRESSSEPAPGRPRPSDEMQNWPSFRGPGASGVVDGFETPVEWNVENGENVLWKTRIPGLAHSSPVIWGERIFLTTAIKEGSGDAELKVGLYGDIMPVDDESVHEMRVLSVDKETGEILWSKLAHKGVPKIKRHPKGSHAASSPATDGKRVVAFFGSEGLYCYAMQGELLWSRDFGTLDSGFYMVKGAQWGFASSPVLFEDKVIVQCDVQEGSFIAALDAATGEDVWRVERDDVPTWGTPTVDVREGRRQVLVNGLKHMGGYDLDTGKELWKLSGGGDIPVPTPIVAHDLVFLTNAHGMAAPIYAIDANAKGEFKVGSQGAEQIEWFQRQRGNYMQTPLVYGPYLFCCSDSGVLACYDALSGEEIYRERLGSGGSGYTASLIASDGKLYATSEEGEVSVVTGGGEFAVLAVNDMGEECMATPAASEGTLFWRSRKHLIAVAQK